MTETEETELTWEEWEQETQEKQIQFLENNFTFTHFWNYSPTREIIKNNFLQTYIETLAKEVADFYASEHHSNNGFFSSLLSFDDDGSKGGILESIIYNNIEKDYDLDMFYENPELASSLVVHYMSLKPKEKKPTVLSKKTLRSFDWNTKTYK